MSAYGPVRNGSPPASDTPYSLGRHTHSTALQSETVNLGEHRMDYRRKVLLEDGDLQSMRASRERLRKMMEDAIMDDKKYSRLQEALKNIQHDITTREQLLLDRESKTMQETFDLCSRFPTPQSQPQTDEQIEHTFFQECAPEYGGMANIMRQLFQEKDLDSAVTRMSVFFKGKCQDIEDIVKSLQKHRSQCKVLESALSLIEVGIPRVSGEDAFLQTMYPIWSFIYAGSRAIFKAEERAEVTYSGNVTDTCAARNNGPVMSKNSLSMKIAPPDAGSANRSDIIFGFRGFALLRVEAKWSSSDADQDHVTLLKTAEAQLKHTAHWLLSICNRAPFYFGMTCTNHNGKIFLIGPHGNSTDVKTVAEFNLKSREGREEFFWMILVMMRINRSIITCLPRRQGWATVNLALGEGRIYSEHRSSQVPPLDNASSAKLELKCTIRVYEDQVRKFCPIDKTSGEDVLRDFYKDLNSLPEENRPLSLPTKTRIKFTTKEVRAARIISKPVALQPEDPEVDDDSEILLYDILCALQCLHTLGYVHRDVRGPNILRKTDGGWMLIDFEYVGKIDQETGRAPHISAKYNVQNLPDRLRKLRDSDNRSHESDEYWCVMDDLEQLGIYLASISDNRTKIHKFARRLCNREFESAKQALDAHRAENNVQMSE